VTSASRCARGSEPAKGSPFSSGSPELRELYRKVRSERRTARDPYEGELSWTKP
jgi:hypothetical protein